MLRGIASTLTAMVLDLEIMPIPIKYHRNQGAPRHLYNLPVQETKPNLKDMFQQFIQTHFNFVDRIEAKFKQYDAHLKNNEASIRNIEIQLGQISKQLSKRP